MNTSPLAGQTDLVSATLLINGNTLPDTCQLVSVKNGFHLWSETYDRTMDDAFAI